MKDYAERHLGLIFIVLIGIGFLVVESRSTSADELARIMYERDVQQTEQLRSGCQATNEGLRQPFYDFITDAIHAREDSGDIAVADQYRHVRREQIEAVAAIARFPGSPQVDCEARYTLPQAP